MRSGEFMDVLGCKKPCVLKSLENICDRCLWLSCRKKIVLKDDLNDVVIKAVGTTYFIDRS